ncbi:MAG: hypothetical protein C0508_09800 [Cyanobacteria bacterium PR.023]|nr:hypothetical protein [Cyanobacteria bacterium PR.023]
MPLHHFRKLLLNLTGAISFLYFLLRSFIVLPLLVRGGPIARVLKADKGEQAALMFGLGMNNNGTGLVQQVIAALIDLRVFNSEH